MTLEIDNLLSRRGRKQRRVNTGTIEDIDDMDEDYVQQLFEPLTPSLSQQVRLINGNLCSVPEETHLQYDIPESDHEGNVAVRVDKDYIAGPDDG